MTPQELAQQLKARPGAERGQWEARCPAHGDRKASLSIGTAKDGSAVLKCHAGCETPEILKVLGLEWRDLWPERESGQQNGHTLGRIVKTYDYRDEHGALLYQVVRYDPKDFRQRRPDRHGGWIWKLGDVRRVPYRLPEILADTSGELWIFEGEKDADRAAALGLNATTTAGGAESFSKTAEAMRVVATGMHMYCLPDADDAGDVYARTALAALRPVAASIRSVYLPRLTQQADHGEDFSDWLDAHDGTLEELRMVAGEQPGRTTPAADDHHDQRDGGGDEREDGGDDEEEETASEKKRPPSIAVQLVELAHACEFFHDAEREAWVTFPVGGHKETTRVNAGAFWDWVEHKFHTATGRTANAAAKQEAQGVFRGRAKFDGPQRAVHVRLAEHEGATYVDLADEARQVIKITAQGWDVVPDAPVKFWRPKGLLPLPVPVKGGKIAPLRQFVNITDEQWPLFVGYLVGCLRASDAGGHPVAAIDGEQGSAKSTLARIIKLLLDPNRAPLRSEPSDKRDLAITAQNNRVLAYDNLSGTMQGWLSDSLCRISTGGGHATRQLYTDADEMIFDSTRPIVLTSIADVASKSDLVDRAIFLSLPRIPDDQRREEGTFWPLFEQVRPGILGALLTAVSMALRRLPTTAVKNLPRMADFAKWVIAAETALPWEPGTFLEAYRANRAAANTLALDASLVGQAMLELIPAGGEWKGTSKELLAALNAKAPQNEKKPGWPGTARAMSSALRIIAPNLRGEGFSIPDDTKRARQGNVWHITRAALEKEETPPPQPPQPPPAPKQSALALVEVGVEVETSPTTSTPTSTPTSPENTWESGGSEGGGGTDPSSSNGYHPEWWPRYLELLAQGFDKQDATYKAMNESR